MHIEYGVNGIHFLVTVILLFHVSDFSWVKDVREVVILIGMLKETYCLSFLYYNDCNSIYDVIP